MPRRTERKPTQDNSNYRIRLGIMLFALAACIVFAYRNSARLSNRSVGGAACRDCNVILISLDTLSANHLPCYGYDRNTAPNLCAFAKNNILFSRSYAQSYRTLPSTTSIFTSRYPSGHGLLTPGAGTLSPSDATLAEIMQKNGYETLYFGPTGSDELPLQRGLGRGFTTIEPNYTYERTDSLDKWKKGIDMLRDNSQSGKKTFLFLHTYYVHEPYLPGTRNLHFSTESIPDIPVTKDEYFSFPADYIRYAQNYLRQNPPEVNPKTEWLFRQFQQAGDYATAKPLYDRLTKENCGSYCVMPYFYYENNKNQKDRVAYMKSLYDELILQLDGQLREVLTSVGPLLEKNTILIITADHGEGFMEHGSLMHRSLYSEIIRVPLIMSVPNISAKSIGVPAEGIDIFPTILGLTGIAPYASAEGADLTDVIRGRLFAEGKPHIISELYDMIPGYRTLVPSRQRTIIDGRWKLYVRSLDDPTGKNLELYDTFSDRWDSRNVAGQHPAVVSALLKKLDVFAKGRTARYPAPPDTNRESSPQQQRYFHY